MAQLLPPFSASASEVAEPFSILKNANAMPISYVHTLLQMTAEPNQKRQGRRTTIVHAFCVLGIVDT